MRHSIELGTRNPRLGAYVASAYTISIIRLVAASVTLLAHCFRYHFIPLDMPHRLHWLQRTPPLAVACV